MNSSSNLPKVDARLSTLVSESIEEALGSLFPCPNPFGAPRIELQPLETFSKLSVLERERRITQDLEKRNELFEQINSLARLVMSSQ